MTFEVVYLARHGQTQWNRERRGQGQLDSPLTAARQMHAADLGRLATALDIECVACSPIGRAVATATVTAEALCMKPLVVDELAEVHHGDMAGLTNAEADARFPGMLTSRLDDKYRWRFPGGESYADADERASRALGRVAYHWLTQAVDRVPRDDRSHAAAVLVRKSSSGGPRHQPTP